MMGGDQAPPLLFGPVPFRCEMRNDPRAGGGSGRPRASPRYPGVGPHFTWALPGVARPRDNEGAGAARGVSGGRAVAAAALSRGRAGKKRTHFYFSATWLNVCTDLVFLYTGAVQKARQVAKNGFLFVFVLYLFGFPNLKQKNGRWCPEWVPHPRVPDPGAMSGVCPTPGLQGASRSRGLSDPGDTTPVGDPGVCPTPPCPGVVSHLT